MLAPVIPLMLRKLKMLQSTAVKNLPDRYAGQHFSLRLLSYARSVMQANMRLAFTVSRMPSMALY
jgi:hypothetical protein